MGRNLVVDIAKLIYTFPIVLVHASAIAVQTGPYAVSPVFGGGYLAVEFFFIVSGYLFAEKAMKAGEYNSETIGTETFQFLKKKITTILPFYVVAWVFTLLIYVMFTQGISLVALIQTAKACIFDFFALRMAGFPSAPFNGILWYLSAMYLSILIFYPLIRKNKNIFIYNLAPIIAIFIYGYISQTRGNISAATIWLGVCQVGMLRGLAGMALGCICYEAARCLFERGTKNTGEKLLLTIMEMAAYIIPLPVMHFFRHSQIDFMMIPFFFIAIAISFSGQSYTGDLQKKIKSKINWIGQISTSLFLAHSVFIVVVKNKFDLETTLFTTRLAYYLAGAIILSVVTMFLGRFILKIYQNKKRAA